MPRVLVLNPGDGTGVNFANSLAGVPGYSTVGMAGTVEELHNATTDETVVRQWGHGDELVDVVNELVECKAIDLVYVADTGPEMDAISPRREAILSTLLLPDLDDHLVMEDKWETWLRLKAAGIAVPDTVLVKDPADLRSVLDRNTAIWLRRRSGSAGAGSMPTDSLAFAEAWVEENHGWGDFLAATRLSRRTSTFSGLWWDGQLVASQLRERLGWKHSYLSASGVTGITGCQRTVWDDDLHELAERSVRATAKRPHGIIGVDFTYSDDGTPMPTEVQPARFYSSIYFLTRCGLNLPQMYCELALAETGTRQLKEPLINPIREEMYWIKAVDRHAILLTADEFWGSHRRE